MGISDLLNSMNSDCKNLWLQYFIKYIDRVARSLVVQKAWSFQNTTYPTCTMPRMLNSMIYEQSSEPIHAMLSNMNQTLPPLFYIFLLGKKRLFKINHDLFANPLIMESVYKLKPQHIKYLRWFVESLQWYRAACSAGPVQGRPLTSQHKLTQNKINKNLKLLRQLG